MAVTMHLDEIGKDVAHIVHGVGAIRVTRNARDLPGTQIAVDILGELLALLAQLLDFGRDVDSRIALHLAQFFDLVFKLGDGLLEIEKGPFGHLNSFGGTCRVL